MRKWLLSEKKAQFFIVSIVIIIGILFGINTLFASYSDVDLTQISVLEETYVFWNIKDQLTRTIENTDCQYLDSNLKEIKLITEDHLAKKGIEFELDYIIVSCPPKDVLIKMNLTSTNARLYEEFSV